MPLGLCGSISFLSAAEPGNTLLPSASPGFTVELVAREPLIRNPCAMAFDSRGRLFVGQGPQYRNPKPTTPGDTVEILIDTDGDGILNDPKNGGKDIKLRLWARDISPESQVQGKLITSWLQDIGLEIEYTVVDEGALVGMVVRESIGELILARTGEAGPESGRRGRA